MRTTSKDIASKLSKTDLAVVFAFEGRKPGLPDGVTSKAADAKFAPGARKTRVFDASGATSRLVVVGLGDEKQLDAEGLRRAAAVAIKTAKSEEANSVALWCGAEVASVLGPEASGCALAEGAVMGAYGYTRFKTSKSEDKQLDKATLHGPGAKFKQGVARGTVLGEANCFARDLQNAPANKLTPRMLAAEAQKLAKQSPQISCRVHDEKAMDQMKMGALLGVSAGSAEPARLIHLVYKPKKKALKKVALVGKGLTFDTGGISLKPSPKMWDMKYDMSGGAAVLGVFHALASMSVPIEVHGIVPASENLPDALAQKPGDVVTAMDGQTIEVLNTDAEGRLILCDALCYTRQKVEPDTIIDLATLTGAVVIALGHELTGMFATSDELRDALTAAGKATGEEVWPLPLMDFHKEQMKGEVADLRNINMPNHGNGATSGAAFLSHFVGDSEWCHLDIAGAAWGARERDYVGGAQGTGVGVRLLLAYLEGLG